MGERVAASTGCERDERDETPGWNGIWTMVWMASWRAWVGSIRAFYDGGERRRPREMRASESHRAPTSNDPEWGGTASSSDGTELKAVQLATRSSFVC